MSGVGLQHSCPRTKNQGGSSDLGHESSSAENLTRSYCPRYKLFLKIGLRLNLGEEQRLFSVFGKSNLLFRSLGKRNLLFAHLASGGEKMHVGGEMGWGYKGMVYFYEDLCRQV